MDIHGWEVYVNGVFHQNKFDLVYLFKYAAHNDNAQLWICVCVCTVNKFMIYEYKYINSIILGNFMFNFMFNSFFYFILSKYNIIVDYIYIYIFNIMLLWYCSVLYMYI